MSLRNTKNNNFQERNHARVEQIKKNFHPNKLYVASTSCVQLHSRQTHLFFTKHISMSDLVEEGVGNLSGSSCHAHLQWSSLRYVGWNSSITTPYVLLLSLLPPFTLLFLSCSHD